MINCFQTFAVICGLFITCCFPHFSLGARLKLKKDSENWSDVKVHISAAQNVTINSMSVSRQTKSSLEFKQYFSHSYHGCVLLVSSINDDSQLEYVARSTSIVHGFVNTIWFALPEVENRFKASKAVIICHDHFNTAMNRSEIFTIYPDIIRIVVIIALVVISVVIVCVISICRWYQRRKRRLINQVGAGIQSRIQKRMGLSSRSASHPKMMHQPEQPMTVTIAQPQMQVIQQTQQAEVTTTVTTVQQ